MHGCCKFTIFFFLVRTKEYSLRQLQQLACSLAKKSSSNHIFALYGDLGSGKTTFASFFINSLVPENVNSPTFVHAITYKSSNKLIHHLDLYKVSSIDMLQEIGIDYFLESGICLIEWPQISETILPTRNRTNIYFKHSSEQCKRIIEIV